MSDREVDLIGQPLRPGKGTVSGVAFVVEGTAMGEKSESGGVYTLDGHRFKVKAGDPIPEGAELAGDKPEKRNAGPAPENKAKAAVPEVKAKKDGD